MTTSFQILLVDDLALVRRSIPARLGSLGMSVAAVASVPEAREWMQRQLPALVLLDLILPGVDGFAYCRELKADPRTAHIPVITLTDLKTNAYMRSLEAGADDYLPKRADDAIMRIRVKLHLQLADLRKRDGYRPVTERNARILLVTPSSLLQAQIPAQLSGPQFTFKVVDGVEDVEPALQPGDTLLILDMALGIEGVEQALTQIRMNPDTATLPVLLLLEKEETEHLAGIEFMVDDVIWKPLKAQVNKARFLNLIELGLRSSM